MPAASSAAEDDPRPNLGASAVVRGTDISQLGPIEITTADQSEYGANNLGETCTQRRVARCKRPRS